MDSGGDNQCSVYSADRLLLHRFVDMVSQAAVNLDDDEEDDDVLHVILGSLAISSTRDRNSASSPSDDGDGMPSVKEALNEKEVSVICGVLYALSCRVVMETSWDL